MKIFILSILIAFLPNTNVSQEDLIGEISSQFHQGNAKEIARYFSPTVNLSIFEENNVYSKVQAEIIIGAFVKRNQPTNSKVIHRLDNNPNYQHAIIELKTETGIFRVSYSIRVSNSKAQLVEIRIHKTAE